MKTTATKAVNAVQPLKPELPDGPGWTPGPPIPGPYRAERNSVKAISHGKWFTVARVDNPRFTPEAKERMAEFIAVGPDLYAACQHLLELVEQCQINGVPPDSSDWPVEQARAAIAKAAKACP